MNDQPASTGARESANPSATIVPARRWRVVLSLIKRPVRVGCAGRGRRARSTTLPNVRGGTSPSDTGTPEQWWREFCYRLRMAGYDGWLSIEHEDIVIGRVEGVRRSVALLRDCAPIDPSDYVVQDV